jgi:hypothetical protein
MWRGNFRLKRQRIKEIFSPGESGTKEQFAEQAEAIDPAGLGRSMLRPYF